MTWPGLVWWMVIGWIDGRWSVVLIRKYPISSAQLQGINLILMTITNYAIVGELAFVSQLWLLLGSSIYGNVKYKVSTWEDAAALTHL